MIKCDNTGVSLFVGSGEKRGSQPVGLHLPGFVDCLPDRRQFIRAKPHRDELPKSIAPWFLWSANFSGHTKIISVTRKFFLHEYNLCVTDIQVSNETALSLDRMAGAAAGESELTNSQPVVAGASRIESEMNAQTFQVGNSDRQGRLLKVEATGDFFYRKIRPKIRLSGQWLAQAGFLPGHRVQVLIEQPGCLTLRFMEQEKEGAL